MDLTGSRILPAPRTAVWAHLIAPDSLARCIPGCERVTGNPVDGFDMVVSQNLVLTKVTFEGTIELSDVVPATSVTLTGRGKGGVAGHAKGSAGIRLDDHPVGTEISWDLGALLEGRVARIGRGVVHSLATRMTMRFLDRLEALLADTAETRP